MGVLTHLIQPVNEMLAWLKPKLELTSRKLLNAASRLKMVKNDEA